MKEITTRVFPRVHATESTYFLAESKYLSDLLVFCNKMVVLHFTDFTIALPDAKPENRPHPKGALHGDCLFYQLRCEVKKGLEFGYDIEVISTPSEFQYHSEDLYGIPDPTDLDMDYDIVMATQGLDGFAIRLTSEGGLAEFTITAQEGFFPLVEERLQSYVEPCSPPD